MEPRKRKTICGGTYCSAINCTNNRNKFPHLSFFHFPTDPVRCKKWVKNVRRVGLEEKTSKQLNASYSICSTHFEDSQFMNASTKKKRLIHNAVPTLFDFSAEDKGPTPWKQSPEERKLIEECMSKCKTRAVDGHAEGKDQSEHQLQTSRSCFAITSMGNADGGGTTNKMEEMEQVWRIGIPFSDSEAMMLVTEYLHLYEMFQNLKGLARINVDLLYLSTNLSKVPKSKEEVDKVQKLIHILMNEREVNKIEIGNLKDKAGAGAEVDFDSNPGQNVLVPEEGDAIQEVGNEFDTTQDLVKVTQTLSKEPHLKTLKDRIELKQYLDSPDSRKSSGTWFCKFCDHQFSSEMSLKRHLVKHLENKSHICTQCDREFKDPSYFRRHVLAHHRNKKKKCHRCRECGCEFSYKYILNQHRKFTHSFVNKSELCSFCGITFKSKSSLLKHLKRHEEWEKKSPRKCEVCGEELSVKDDLSIHMKCHTGREFMCDVCGKAFSKRQSFKYHKSMVHTLDREVCPICGKMITKTNLKRHVQEHSGDKPFKCTVCNKGFSQSAHRAIHLKRHFGQYLYHCSHCGAGFNSHRSLNLHENYHTRKRQFSCLGCDQLFLSETSATTHTRDHGHSHSCTLVPHKKISKLKYKCSYCSKSLTGSTRFAFHMYYSHNKEPDRCLLCNDNVIFPLSQDLESHMTSVHFGERPFKCGTCGEYFYKFKDLYAHQNLYLHYEEKEFKCDECGRSYSRHQSLRNHLVLKHSAQPLVSHECDICGKRFDDRSNLRRHRNIHSGVKPHICSVCGSAFKEKAALELHSWTHADTKKFQCRKCDKGFNDKRNYVSHVKKSHPEVL